MSVCAHLLIRGKVQGVWYRRSAKETALSLGLSGWVRNLPGGEVEALVEGEEEKVEMMIAWCRRGPERARVDAVEVERRAPCGLPHPFEMRPTP